MERRILGLGHGTNKKLRGLRAGGADGAGEDAVDYQIAFVLGIMREESALVVRGRDDEAAAIEVELEVRSALFAGIAKSKWGKKCGGDDVSWARAQGGFESAPEREPKKANNKRSLCGTEPWSPDYFQVFGPNGERLA